MSHYAPAIRSELADEIAAARSAYQLATVGRRIPTGAPEWAAFARRMDDLWGHESVRRDAERFVGKVSGRRRYAG